MLLLQYLATLSVLTALAACSPAMKKTVSATEAPSPPAAAPAEGKQDHGEHLGNPEEPYPLATPPNVGDIVHLPTGTLVTPEQLLAVAADARIVYVGETHDNPASHRLQLQLLRGLSERHPGRVALGMEMFAPSQQKALDRWVEGELDELSFLKEARWFDRWRMDFDYYRDLLLLARERKIPVIALNAEKETVAALRSKAPGELSAEERSRIPELDFNDPYQRAMVDAVFGGHAHGNLGLEGFVRAQTLWDETMADSVARYLSSAAGRDKHLLVVAGSNHISYGFGIPRRVFRRLPSSYVTVGGQEINIGKDKQDRLMNVDYPEFPMVPYDFLAFLSYEDLPKKQMLGVQIEGGDSGVRVVKVVPGSLAEGVGIEVGDRILSLDGRRLEDSFDLVYAVQHKRAGERAVLEIERKGEVLKKEVLFKEQEGDSSQ